MATWTTPDCRAGMEITEPTRRQIVAAVSFWLVLVIATRSPLARPSPFDSDEMGYLEMIQEASFPKHHTLFLASGRVLGDLAGDPYRGFVLLDMLTSGLALAAVWWWLRAVVGPWTAAAATLALSAGPVFWSYGGMAANYTAIPLVGSLLFGIAWRGRKAPKPWHPFAAAVILGLGTGYRQDIGTFWLPVFGVILWQHRWMAAVQAGLLFVAVNFGWLIPMLHDAGGLELYLRSTREFADKAGYRNSVWHLGWIDASVRNAVKAAMALLWTLGPGLLFVPRGVFRIARDANRWLLLLIVLPILPALALHLMIHFGVAGYAFHYVPALVVLIAVGIGRVDPFIGQFSVDAVAAWRSVALAAFLAAVFLFYPTNMERTDRRGDFDLAFARHTRVGLRTKPPLRDPDTWRTMNSQRLPGSTEPRPSEPRRSLVELLWVHP